MHFQWKEKHQKELEVKIKEKPFGLDLLKLTLQRIPQCVVWFVKLYQLIRTQRLLLSDHYVISTAQTFLKKLHRDNS